MCVVVQVVLNGSYDKCVRVNVVFVMQFQTNYQVLLLLLLLLVLFRAPPPPALITFTFTAITTTATNDATFSD